MAGETLVLRDSSGREYRVTISDAGSVIVNDVSFSVKEGVDGSLHIQGTRNAVAWAVVSNGTRWVFLNGDVFTFEIERPGRRRPSAPAHGSLAAPMPATVRNVLVAPGARVQKGDVLVVLEAMKMELPIRATGDGIVEAVFCREGEMVQPGAELVKVLGAD